MSVPLKQYVSVAREANSWTPDLPYLTKTFSFVPLFVYNQFKIGMSEHALLRHAPLLAYGHTLTSDYTVLLTDEGEPLAFVSSDDDSGGISGEIFQVPIPLLTEIDRTMCNTVHVERKFIPIRVATSRANSAEYTAGCFMYLGIEENLKPFIHRFTRPMMLARNSGRFFLYTAIMDIKAQGKRNRAAL